MIFQSYNLVPYLTVRQNVELPARLAHRPHDAQSALAAVSLGSFGDRYPSQLSGGQQQRVAIARILASPPPLVLADEPTGALDSVAGAEVVDLLAGLPDRGVAVALVTHDLTAAARAARAVVMRDGRNTADVVAPTADRLFELMTGG
jgi:putative ABC transport system ATP-binding protein